MNLEMYSEEVKRTSREGQLSERELRENFTLGLIGEVGEVADLIKKQKFHGHEIPKELFLKELGDVTWYSVAFLRLICDPVLLREAFASVYALTPEPQSLSLLSRAMASSLHPVLTSRGQLEVAATLCALLTCVRCAAETLGSSLSKVLNMNVAKLRARFPEGFSEEASKNRKDVTP